MTTLSPTSRGRHPVWIAASASIVLLHACGDDAHRASTPTGAPPAATSGSGAEDDDPVEEAQSTAGASEGDTPPASTAPGAMAEVVAAHNRHRAAHCAPPLTWSEELANTAQGWADRLAAQGCSLTHSQSNYGENLAMATAGTLGPQAVTDLWYSENAHYDFRRGGFSMRTGHFTQLAWIGTTRIGCGKTTCSGLDVWVCNYDPPGNVRGEYQTNVLPTSCR